MRRFLLAGVLLLSSAACNPSKRSEDLNKVFEEKKPEVRVDPPAIPKLQLNAKEVVFYKHAIESTATGVEGRSKVDYYSLFQRKGEATLLYGKKGSPWLVEDKSETRLVESKDPKVIEAALKAAGSPYEELVFYTGTFSEQRAIEDSGEIPREGSDARASWAVALKVTNGLEGRTLKAGDTFDLDKSAASSLIKGIVMRSSGRPEANAKVSVESVPNENSTLLVLSLQTKGTSDVTDPSVRSELEATVRFEYDLAAGIPVRVKSSCRTLYRADLPREGHIEVTVVDTATFEMEKRAAQAPPAEIVLDCTVAPGDRVKEVVTLGWIQTGDDSRTRAWIERPLLEMVQVFGEGSKSLTDYKARCKVLRAVDWRDLAALRAQDPPLLPCDGETMDIGLSGGQMGGTDLHQSEQLTRMQGWPGMMLSRLPTAPVRLHDDWSSKTGEHGFLVTIEDGRRAVIYLIREETLQQEKPAADFAAFLVFDIVAKKLLSISFSYADRDIVGSFHMSLTWGGRISLNDPSRREEAHLRALALVKQGDGEKKPEAAFGDYFNAWQLLKGSIAREHIGAFDRFAEICRELKRHDTEAEVLEKLCAVKCTPERHRRWIMALLNDRHLDQIVTAAEKYAEAPDDAEWHMVLSRAYVYKRKYQKAKEHLDAAARILQADVSHSAALVPQHQYMIAGVLLNMGKFDDAAKALNECRRIDDAYFKANDGWTLMMEIKEAQKLGIYIRFKEPEFLPLGTYHLMKERGGTLPPFIELHLINGGSEDRMISFTSEVLDVTHESVDQFVLPGRVAEDIEPRGTYNIRVYQTPSMRHDFNVNNITEEIEKPLRITLKERTDGGEKVLLQKTIPVTLWPRRRIPLYIDDPEIKGSRRFYTQALAAWVTPRAKFVQNMVKEAKKYLKPGMEFYGGVVSSAQKDNVEAIYNYLKAQGLSYVAYTSLKRDNYMCQDVRLPYDSLKSTNNLCIEGTVLFATAMESIGMHPSIVLVPGHAFVAWEDFRGGARVNGRHYYALETTVIASKTFEEALTIGESELNQHKDCFNARTNCLIMPGTLLKDQLLDIVELRTKGYTPQPYAED